LINANEKVFQLDISHFMSKLRCF